MTMLEEVSEAIAFANYHWEDQSFYDELADAACDVFNKYIAEILNYLHNVVIKDGEQFVLGEINRLLKQYEDKGDWI